MSGKRGEGGREGGNMTSCPAGSVSSSLDSLEKLFSLQLSGKKSFGFSALLSALLSLYNVFFSFFARSRAGFHLPNTPF